MVAATYDLVELCLAANIRKLVAASTASVYGMADQFPTPEAQHPYNNRTLYGAAKAFNEGLYRSFNDMHGLDYVALRYFNVYGPRMDIHGRYTEVLVRWMERLARGEPPIIFGDGLQTMDMIHVRDVARANILSAVAPASDVALNIGSGTETSLLDLARLLCRVMGQPAARTAAPGGRAVNPVPQRLADVSKARELIGFEATHPARGGHRRAGRLVAFARAARRSSPRDPDHQAPYRRGGSRCGRGRAFRLADARPARRRASRKSSPPSPARPTPAPCPTAPRRCISLCLPSASAPGDEVITVSHTFIACANAIHQCGATPVFIDIEPVGYGMDAALIAAAITPRTRAILCVHQIGMPCDMDASWPSPAPMGCRVVEDAACALGSRCSSMDPGNDRRSGRRRRMLLAASAEGRHRRRWRHADHAGCRARCTLPPAAPARHDRAGHGAPRQPQVIFESYESGLQLPPDRHPGGGRHRAAQAPAGDRLAPAGLAERYRERIAAETPEAFAPVEPNRVHTNWQSYAVRLPDGWTSARRCNPCSTAASPRAVASCASIARSPMPRRRASPADLGRRAGPHNPAAALSADDGGRAGSGDRRAARGAAALNRGRVGVLGASPTCPQTVRREGRLSFQLATVTREPNDGVHFTTSR